MASLSSSTGLFQMLRYNRGQTDFQRWMVKYDMARQKAIEIWLDITTPRPDPAGAQVTALLGLRGTQGTHFETFDNS